MVMNIKKCVCLLCCIFVSFFVFSIFFSFFLFKSGNIGFILSVHVKYSLITACVTRPKNNGRTSVVELIEYYKKNLTGQQELFLSLQLNKLIM